MASSRRRAPRATRAVADDAREAPRRYEGKRACEACGTPLSAYNAGPHCWRHSLGMPWRGPSAGPKLG